MRKVGQISPWHLGKGTRARSDSHMSFQSNKFKVGKYPTQEGAMGRKAENSF